MTSWQTALDQIKELADRYLNKRGNYRSQTSDTGSSWSNSPELDVPEKISRGDLLNNPCSDNPVELKNFFIRVMAWGYGPAGYAKFRTDRVIENFVGDVHSESSNLAKWMVGLKKAAMESPVDGFCYLSSDEGRVKYLGLAFSTKLFYFLSPPDNRAPILDSVVNRWLWSHGVASEEKPISVDYQNPEGYKQYVNFCDQAASLLSPDMGKPELGDRGFIEYLIFQDQLAFEANLTLDSWIRDDLTSKRS